MVKSNYYSRSLSMEMKSQLALNQLKFNLSLGVYDYEKKNKQKVIVNLKLVFSDIPRGCKSDKIKEVVCYDHLIKHLKQQINDKHFELIENFSWFLAEKISSFIEFPANVSVEVIKKPKIKGLKSASFSLIDFDSCL